MTSRTTAPAVPRRSRLRPLGLDEVTITGGFWGHRQHVNATATLTHIEAWLERAGWIANFDLAAAGRLPAGRRGREFADSEVYKYLEALAWEIRRASGTPAEADLEARFRAITSRVGAAQEPDGYLNTMFGRPGQSDRWSDLQWGHELYCTAFLVQAAIARARTRPGADDGLLDIAVASADLVCEVFGEDGREAVCGHAAIESALVELARVTGAQRYLAQAARFVDLRGHGTLGDIEFGRAYYQDDTPVRDADVLRGHAVRANYLAAGAVDVATETGDEALFDALTRQWSATVARRTYLTGGQGSHHQDEAFGDDWVLPPDRAYSETCAAIASTMFSWRLLLATADPRYADLIERTLLNVVATAPSGAGTAFFYANTLHQRRPGTPAGDDQPSPRASAAVRAPWFDVSCCPTNIARTLSALAAHVATVDDDGLQMHQYAPATVDTALPDGTPVALDVETDYPLDGIVRLHVRSPAVRPWTLTLRVPPWATGARLLVKPAGGRTTETAAEPGTVSVRHGFGPGDLVELHLPTAPRFTTPDSRIDAVRGCVAVERGPEVLCLESVDLAAATGGRVTDIADVAIDTTVPPRQVGPDVLVRLQIAGHTAAAWPYAEPTEHATAEPAPAVDVALVAYHSWGERGPTAMRVFLPEHHSPRGLSA